MEKTIECGLHEVDKELRILIEDILDQGEEVKVCFRVEFHMVWVEVITSRRVIMAKAIALRSNVFSFKPKIEMPVLSSIQINDIARLEPGKSEEYDLFTVKVFSKDGKVLETNFTLEAAARKFYQTLSAAIDKGDIDTSSKPAAERLRELKGLLEENLISEEEFRQKRAEILKNI